MLCAEMVRPSAAEGPATGSAVQNTTLPATATEPPGRLPMPAWRVMPGQTRFILDLDRAISFRAFALADPYRVILDIPQVSFKLAAGTGAAGRGLIKAFRYGLVIPAVSRIVFDLTGPAKIAKSYVLEAANDQPPRLVIEFEEVDRTTFVSCWRRRIAPNCGRDCRRQCGRGAPGRAGCGQARSDRRPEAA